MGTSIGLVAETKDGERRVALDPAIEQGGCVATARPTRHSDPTYVAHGVLHYWVTNVPGQYPRTASRALSAAVAPYVRQLATDPTSEWLAGSLNVADGRIVHPAVAEALVGSTAGSRS